MTRRSPIATLLRIAELQEAVARGAAGKALTEARAAAQEHEQEQARLREAGLAGGTREALESTTQVRLWRAAAVGQTAALVEELAARQRAEALTRQERVAQRLADDLTGLRKRRP